MNSFWLSGVDPPLTRARPVWTSGPLLDLGSVVPHLWTCVSPVLYGGPFVDYLWTSGGSFVDFCGPLVNQCWIIVGPYWILGSFGHWAFNWNFLCHCRALRDVSGF